jgi:hypothetical protein
VWGAKWRDFNGISCKYDANQQQNLTLLLNVSLSKMTADFRPITMLACG